MTYYFPRPAARRAVLKALMALEHDNSDRAWRPFYPAYDVHSRMLDSDGCDTTMSIGTCRKILNWLANTSAVEKYSRGAGRAKMTGYRLTNAELAQAK